MSMDAGGLAQMTYNNFPANNGLGMPTAGFASRGKASQLKRLSVHPPSSIPENEGVATPRTARGHLLAGLRTAPKTPSVVPSSAPFGQTQHRVGLENSRFAQENNAARNGYARPAPQTASAATFASAGYNNNNYAANAAFAQQQQLQLQQLQQQMYPLVEQPLAPPTFNLNAHELQQMDPEILAEMMRQSMYLEQKRKLLEQQIQLINLQAQHSQGLTLNPLLQQQFPATPLSPSTAMFGVNGGGLEETVAHGLGLSQDVSAGQYMFWNAQTGQYNYIPTTGAGLSQAGLANSPPPPTPSFTSSPPNGSGPMFRAEVSSAGSGSTNPYERRTPTPPKSTPSPPNDVAPLPPTSSNGWRRGHKKVSSLAFSTPASESGAETPKSALIRPTGIPQTPLTGTFGPGQGRAGEHPVRQPRGPPPMDELVAAPTTKHEGSKNFASRQRRGALSKLVRAGMERRGARTGSAGSMTPVSETDPIFSLAGSDNDSDSGRSLSGRPSIGSLRAQASGAIGSERKKRRDSKERSRDRTDSHLTSITSDEVAKFAALEEPAAPGERKKMPMLLLTSAEKRKSTLY